MDAIKELFNRKIVIALLALILGIALGLVYAWVVSPVEWINGVPSQLRRDLQVDYLRMVIDSHAINQDDDLANERYANLGPDKGAILTEVGEDPGLVKSSDIQRFKEIVEEIPSVEETAAPSDEEEAESGIVLSRLLLPVCGATLVLGLLLAAALVLRRRMESGEPPISREPEYVEELDYPTDATMPVDQPLATFRTTYSLGDDLYDDSFSIESATGDFLGECGVGIGDVIGVGDPKKVSAFEVWLFDKNDIQTVTKVAMSRYAFRDEETRGRLSAKGDPVEAVSGDVITLDTASLRVEARVVDMNYGESALPPSSFFERLTVELRAFPKGF
ncbi:MAG: hypothetical protein GTO14_14760 [Anaerolineales bacterium]|nr:hypothetical protein [Anaerolineales bacterium]